MADLATTLYSLMDMSAKILKRLSKVEKNIFRVQKHLSAGCHKCGDHLIVHESVMADSSHAAHKMVVTTPNEPKGVNRVVADGHDIKSKELNPKTGKKRCMLSQHDWIVEAFHYKFKTEEGKKWLLKEEDWVDVVAAVNEKGAED